MTGPGTNGRANTPAARALLLAGLLFGCSENGFRGGNDPKIAVTYGDFDDLTPALDRLSVPHNIYDGIISNPTWSETDVAGVPAENLFLNNEARLHEAVWITSGTRGLGNTVYNRNERDDALVVQVQALETARKLVKGRRNLLVTDWAYDLVEHAWPDAIEFYGQDTRYDDAQQGDIGTVVARVTDERLVEALGMEQLVVDYNFSNWAVITDVGPDTTVWLRGDVRAWNGEAFEELVDVPLLVSFEPEGSGRVVVMTFHANAQPAAVTDTILTSIVGPLPSVAD